MENGDSVAVLALLLTWSIVWVELCCISCTCDCSSSSVLDSDNCSRVNLKQ